jgi:hypothetical protein
MAHIAGTCVGVDGGPARAMEKADGFFCALGASIVKREVHSMLAAVSHPDGFGSDVEVNYHTNGEDAVLEFRRCSGDWVLFDMVFKMFLDFNMGYGTAPGYFNDGQILPRVSMTSSPPPMDVPALRLDGGGEKRKVGEAEL